jgi:hypothetical protein
MVQITEAELLEALRLATEQDPDGCFSTAEIGTVLGVGIDAARARIKLLLNAGRLEFAGRQKRPAMDGIERPVPVYRLTTART